VAFVDLYLHAGRRCSIGAPYDCLVAAVNSR